jgi:hypothetical protein
MDELIWSIWPNDNVDRIIEILDQNDEYLERRHCMKLETLLHRFVKMEFVNINQTLGSRLLVETA